MKKLKIVFSTGAGVSAESGVKTFRDADGLWENYPVMQVASAEGFAADPALVHEFYNARRRQLLEVEPNEAHRLIAELAEDPRFDVKVITQNVDDLHERAGSKDVLHLHGELMKIRSVKDEDYIEDLSVDDIETTPERRGRNGHPMRPHIVFFNEAVPNITVAMQLAAEADVFVVIGTSLAVYPAAGLIRCVRRDTKIYYIDPNPANVGMVENLTIIREKATVGMKKLMDILDAKSQ
ncbi:MAG: NAD-dependent deacylase [Bacteroidales bacterium]|nr:NAD-dependent deacylase [Bacteroidales bacterium]